MLTGVPGVLIINYSINQKLYELTQFDVNCFKTRSHRKENKISYHS